MQRGARRLFALSRNAKTFCTADVAVQLDAASGLLDDWKIVACDRLTGLAATRNASTRAFKRRLVLARPRRNRKL
jgi:hypothetical protein